MKNIMVGAFLAFVCATNPDLNRYELSAALVAASDVALPRERRLPAWWKQLLGPPPLI